jgi:hypothetical protein
VSDEPTKPEQAAPPAARQVTEPTEPTEPTDDVIFETLWSRVVASWDDDKPHAALLDYALRHERLPDAAGRYRALKDDPEKAARAQKKLDGIVVAATQMMLAMKSPPARTRVPWQITLTAFGIMAFILAMIAYGMLSRH